MCANFDELDDEDKIKLIFDYISRQVEIPRGMHSFLKLTGMESLIENASTAETEDS